MAPRPRRVNANDIFVLLDNFVVAVNNQKVDDLTIDDRTGNTELEYAGRKHVVKTSQEFDVRIDRRTRPIHTRSPDNNLPILIPN